MRVNYVELIMMLLLQLLLCIVCSLIVATFSSPRLPRPMHTQLGDLMHLRLLLSIMPIQILLNLLK